MQFLDDVASMQIDQTAAALNDGGYEGINNEVYELVAYAENIRDRRDLVQNHYFALALAQILTIRETRERALMFNFFIKSHGYFTVDVNL